MTVSRKPRQQRRGHAVFRGPIPGLLSLGPLPLVHRAANVARESHRGILHGTRLKFGFFIGMCMAKVVRACAGEVTSCLLCLSTNRTTFSQLAVVYLTPAIWTRNIGHLLTFCSHPWASTGNIQRFKAHVDYHVPIEISFIERSVDRLKTYPRTGVG